MSGPLILNTSGHPPGVSPLLSNIYTHDCLASSSSISIIKLTDNTVVLAVSYLKWQTNNLALNVNKNKEMVVYFRRKQGSGLTPLIFSGEPFKFLGVHLTQDLSWSLHTEHLVSKSRQRLYFLRRLNKFKVSPSILRTFYSAAVQSILTGCLSAWFESCTARDRASLQRVARTMRSTFATLDDTYRRVRARARKIRQDTSHPNAGLFTLLQSDRPRQLDCLTPVDYNQRLYI